MPAMLDDPTAPAIYRVSGAPPYLLPGDPHPIDISPRQVTLRDRVTIATLIPFTSPQQVPHKLTAYLCALLNREIEKGDTYPMMEPMPLSSFGPYWFANFAAVMLLGDLQSVEEVERMETRGVDWSRECLGSFYVKPNYPGRSSHVCNGGFLVTDAARNRGVGRLMGEGYLEWAPRLGYTYSVFNLVYETNVASLRIWDALGFKRIGRVKGCGNLKSYPDQFIDAIIFGRELGGEGDEYVSEERFDKIRFYLKTGSYPAGSDRAEKSRLRSAATHYRLIPNPDPDPNGSGGVEGEDDKLMLKGKEVVSDPHKQYEIARSIHAAGHGGINKTTASIAESYHWVRIKETVSAAIRNCAECKDVTPKPSQAYVDRIRSRGREAAAPMAQLGQVGGREMVVAGAEDPARSSEQQQQSEPSYDDGSAPMPDGLADAGVQHEAPMANMHYPPALDYSDMPLDPQIMHGWARQDAAPRYPHAPGSHTAHNGDDADPMAIDIAPDDDALARSLAVELRADHSDGGGVHTRAGFEVQGPSEVSVEQAYMMPQPQQLSRERDA
ncbi:Protein spt10 [Teratosphaeriaceae sp. CCFEE 6253]|nr:Protein spt10 [Teratosphaeriaceae sp. CCFEE 6253]